MQLVGFSDGTARYVHILVDTDLPFTTVRSQWGNVVALTGFVRGIMASQRRFCQSAMDPSNGHWECP